MRVLVIEDHPAAGDEACAELVAAGAQVVRCHEAGQPAFPCAGMPGEGGCPMEQGPVDVALSVRARAGAPTEREDGVRCALRHHVPVVAAGDGEDVPWRSLATPLRHDEDLLQALRRAADAPLRRHSEVAAAQLADLLERKGLDPAASSAEVHRVVGGLRVVLRPGPDVPATVAQAAAVRVAAALRSIDDKSTALDVTIDAGERVPAR